MTLRDTRAVLVTEEDNDGSEVDVDVTEVVGLEVPGGDTVVAIDAVANIDANGEEVAHAVGIVDIEIPKLALIDALTPLDKLADTENDANITDSVAIFDANAVLEALKIKDSVGISVPCVLNVVVTDLEPPLKVVVAILVIVG